MKAETVIIVRFELGRELWQPLDQKDQEERESVERRHRELQADINWEKEWMKQLQCKHSSVWGTWLSNGLETH